MPAHHVDMLARTARAHVAEVHDADDLLDIVICAEVWAPTCSQLSRLACCHAAAPQTMVLSLQEPAHKLPCGSPACGLATHV